MKKDKHITPVIFRVEKDGTILAVFPYNSYRKGYSVTYYSHIGQHGEAMHDYLIGDTKPATPEQYAELKAELEGLGYNLKVIKKCCTRKMYQL